MKFSEVIYKSKNNKLFLVLFVLLCLAFVFDIFILVFDAVKFIGIMKFDKVLNFGFFVINLVAIIFNILVCSYVVFYYFYEKSNKKSQRLK